MTAAEDQTTASRRTGLGWTLGTGAALGAVSLALDELDSPAGEVLRGLFGGGFAWGVAALFAGYLTRGRRLAQVRATVLLVTAILVYYGLIVAVGHRWRGAMVVDGSSAVWVSLASVGRAVLLWLAGAVVAGILMGWLGERIRSGSRYTGALAAGLAAGLLSGQAVALSARVLSWPELDRTGWSLLTSAALTVLLAIAGPAAMLGRANRRPSWLAYLATAAGMSVVAALAWTAVEAVRTSI
ncbi:MAG TPA: hypothetical protein VF163_03960 [Micromonosporaceae bacterium]